MIFFFSGTGNTRWVAESLAALTGDTLYDIAELRQDVNLPAFKKDENVGFIFPVHGWRVPILVRSFIQRLLDETSEEWRAAIPFVWAVATAGDSIGRTMERLQKQLNSGNLSLAYCKSLIMPESYVGLPGMDVDKQEKEREKKQQTAEQFDEIVSTLGSIKKEVDKVGHQRDWQELTPIGWDTLKRGPIPSFFSGPVGGFFERFLITDSHFKVSSDKCIHCGKCQKACPVSNIQMQKGLPQWLHHKDCLTCFACYHHCPNHAIEFGWVTQKKGQYFFDKNEK